MESRLFGLTQQNVRKLAFQLADRNGIQHKFNTNTGMAGKITQLYIYIFYQMCKKLNYLILIYFYNFNFRERLAKRFFKKAF